MLSWAINKEKLQQETLLTLFYSVFLVLMLLKLGGNGGECSEIELEPHILLRLMPDKRIYPFQTPRTNPTSGHFLGCLSDIYPYS